MDFNLTEEHLMIQQAAKDFGWQNYNVIERMNIQISYGASKK
jgi:hypothetical protein